MCVKKQKSCNHNFCPLFMGLILLILQVKNLPTVHTRLQTAHERSLQTNY
jgi:hypothetical protein